MDSSTLIKFLALGVIVLGVVSIVVYRHWDRLHDFVYGTTKQIQTGNTLLRFVLLMFWGMNLNV